MSELDLQTFMAGMADLTENFPDAIFTELKYEIWFEKLSQDLSAEEFKTAIREAIYNFKQCPTGKELAELVKESERELVLECWSRCLDAISRRLSLNDLDDASQYAIAQLGGTGHLSELPIPKLQDLKFDFQSHWQKYRKKPVEFHRPTQVIPPEQREYKPAEVDSELTPEQQAKNEAFKKELVRRMAGAVSFDKKLNNGATENG